MQQLGLIAYASGFWKSRLRPSSYCPYMLPVSSCDVSVVAKGVLFILQRLEISQTFRKLDVFVAVGVDRDHIP